MFHHNLRSRRSVAAVCYNASNPSSLSALESLEKRVLLSNISLSNGKLTVIGSNANDNIVVSYNTSGTHVHAKIIANGVLTHSAQFAKSRITTLFINGRNGNDIISNHTWIADTIWGGSGHDRIAGGHGDTSSELAGQAGHDVIDGRGGNDVIYGQDGNDLLLGGAGHDVIDGGNGEDRILGQLNNDLLRGGAAGDLIYGDHGRDSIEGGAGNDGLHGGHGVDHLFGGAGLDSVFGGSHTDFIHGQSEHDYIHGGIGDDLIRAGRGEDIVYGNGGNDHIFGQDDNDLLYGGVGDDIVRGGNGSDHVYGSDLPLLDEIPTREFRVIAEPHPLYEDEEVLSRYHGHVSGSDVLFGGEGDDYLHAGYGTEEPDTLYGGNGNDILFVGYRTASGTRLYGGNGDDFIDAMYSIVMLELYGGTGRDELIGGWGDEILDGGPGDDYVRGGIGNDLVRGGGGKDILNSEYETYEPYALLIGNSHIVASVYVGLDFSFGGDDETIEGGAGEDTIHYRPNNTLLGNTDEDILVLILDSDFY